MNQGQQRFPDLAFNSQHHGSPVHISQIWGRDLRSVISVGIAFLLCGCAAKTGDKMAEYHQRLAFQKDAAVPLPITTPFDENAVAREVYLTCYRDGFRSGLTGYLLPTSFPPGAYPTARQQGWLHGMSVGWNVWEKKILAESRSTHGQRKEP